MTKNVIVLGLPTDAVFTKLVFAFKGLFRKINITNFWIRELSAVFGANYKQMTVEFTSNTEARKARNFLNNLPFIYGKMEYHLQAEMAQDSMQYETDEMVGRSEQRGRNRKARKRERQRSQSPGYSREASKLDMEIELLRKQRQVIEEERRLLLEQKKLEMIREYGPSATRDFSDFEDFGSNDNESYEPPRKRRHPEPVQAKKRRHTPPPTQKPVKPRPRGLPGFFQPCKTLISDMKQYIDKDTTKEEAEILLKLVRAALRKKLAIALEGKDYMPTRDILNLYREKHPKEEDEAFVGKILSNIRASFLVEPKVEKDEVDAVNVKQENEESDAKDKGKEESAAKGKEKSDTIDEKVAEGEEVAKDVAQEIPANEENGTDTAADDDINVKSNPDPDVSQQSGNVSADVDADVLEIKTNHSMMNNTVDGTVENKVADVQTQGEADLVEEQ